MESPNIPPNPLGEGAFSLLVESTYTAGVSQTLTWYVSGKTHKRLCTNTNDDEWIDWVPIATAIKPQEFSLPLAEGVTTVGAGYKNIYSKDQFGIVRVWFSVHFESIPAKATPVFTLPAGFRPDSVCSFAAILAMNEFYCASVTVDVGGTAIVDRSTIGQTGPINLHGYIEFPAAS